VDRAVGGTSFRDVAGLGSVGVQRHLCGSIFLPLFSRIWLVVVGILARVVQFVVAAFRRDVDVGVGSLWFDRNCGFCQRARAQ
jgi:hypothetical protein